MLAALALAAALAAPAPTVGAYRLPGGDVVSVVRSEGAVRFTDYGTGELRSLTRHPGGLWTGGPGASVPAPVRLRVRVESPARISVSGRAGVLIPIVARRVVFEDGSVRLAGRLLRPSGRGPFPGVVIVPGSEPAHLTTYDLWAYFFAEHGFAVLTYDKRGVGGSGGSYDRAADAPNLERLASDALAGLDWLRRQPGVDPARVGLSGGSQAGWTIEIAAARSRDVRWAALQSGPAMSVGRQLAYAALTRQGWTDPPPTDARIRAGLAGVADSGYDPRQAIASLRIPVLWQLGAEDRRMYTPETLADLKRIEAAGGHDFTIRVYPGGAHSLRQTAQGLIRQEQTSPGFVRRVFPDLAAWLRAHVAR